MKVCVCTNLRKTLIYTLTHSIHLVMVDPTLTGVHNINITALEGFLQSSEVKITSRAYQMIYDTPHYNISGKIVDHLDMFGEGPAQLSIFLYNTTLYFSLVQNRQKFSCS